MHDGKHWPVVSVSVTQTEGTFRPLVNHLPVVFVLRSDRTLVDRSAAAQLMVVVSSADL